MEWHTYLNLVGYFILSLSIKKVIDRLGRAIDSSWCSVCEIMLLSIYLVYFKNSQSNAPQRILLIDSDILEIN